MTGNEVGLAKTDLEALPFNERRRLAAVARRRLDIAGAHVIVDGVYELPRVLPDMVRRIQRGSRPD